MYMRKKVFYHRCPDCGFKQKSKAEKRVKCHNCGSTYVEKSNRCAPPKPMDKDGKFRKASDIDD